ncbi:hypothetical protein [Gelidibacter maritimus]|uniref:Uncharacterized protein n=1 Tax=Gelidibacter maritimus TaxID=2761487 RepID=A0A7W2M3X2_9FLAO|nr:hypothetical protein [Gelidibacter maritimus]MBA6152192.1 hypothetical protein [Gelidibacter maritimus]
MSGLIFIIGAAVGGGACYFYFSKSDKALKQQLNDVNQNLLTQQKTASLELKDLEYELQLKGHELKKTLKENDSTEDRIDDLHFDLSKLKKENQYLKEENEKFSSITREYEMLFKAKKDEIAKLKSQLNK